MQKLVVTLALAPNDDDDDDDDEDEASTEEHRILRRIVGKSQFPAPRTPDIAFATNRLARSLAKPSTSDIVASKRPLRYLYGTMDFGLKLPERAQLLGGRQTHAQVRVFLGDYAGRIPAQRWCSNTVGGWSIIM